MSEDAKGKTRAAPAKKVQQAPARQEGPKQLGLRPWEPGSMAEAPRADPRADGGRPLDPWVRSSMEARFGHDFGRVRIHTGPDAAERASTLGANAYTLGLNVYFGAGKYRPHHPAGQRLIVHELEHVVRAGSAGPAIPMLDPDPAADQEAKLRQILAKGKKGASDLGKFVDAHPGSIEIAERLLAAGTIDSTTVRLLGVLFKRDARSEGRVAELLRKGSAELRTSAKGATLSMLKNYEDAAFAYATVQWATKRRDEEKAKRPKAPKPKKGEKAPPPVLSAEEKQFETWRAEAQARFDALAAERKALLSASNSALEAMVKAAGSLPYIQGDVLEELADEAHGAVDEARRIRIRTFTDVSLLTHEKSASVTKKLAAGEKKIATARAAEEKAREKREKLDPPLVDGMVPAGPDNRAQTARKKAADKALAAAVAKREKAEKAITLEGVRDPELKYFLESQDPKIRAEAEARLKEERQVRQAKLAGHLPTATREPGLDLATLLDDKQLWWIYHTALNNVGSGFPGFSHEATLLGLVQQRSAVSKNRQALGVEHNLSVGTYRGHGEGQYDINTAAGKEIKAVQPAQVDLSRALSKRGRGSGTPLLYEHVSTEVASFTKVDATDGDEDVLAKLAYGFFGREWKDRDKMAEYLSGVRTRKTPKPNPDAWRVVAGLVFENTISGSPPSAEVSTARNEIREKLDTALHAELRKLTPPVDIPDDVKILATLDASEEKQYGAIHMFNPKAVDLFRKVPGKGKKAAYNTDKAKKALYMAIRRIVLDDATVNVPLEKLIADLLGKGKGNRSGPHVTLIHVYKKVGGSERAWIEVDYRHLSEVAALTKGGSVSSGDVIGKVGSSGNAISPHIHMAIRVYEDDPRKDSKYNPVKPVGYLVPLEFFPIERPGAKKKTTPPPAP